MNGYDLTGKSFGRLTVIKQQGANKKYLKLWLCKCECGNTKVATSENLINGSTRSCGCLRKQNTKEMFSKHDMSNTKFYKVWRAVKNRCCNPNDKRYYCYGDRGIKICDKWLKFEGFYADMYDTYKEGLTIDRIDVNGNYCKENCRWTTIKEQMNNKTNNRKITYLERTQTLSEWSDELGINYGKLWKRLHDGWTIEKAFSRY